VFIKRTFQRRIA